MNKFKKWLYKGEGGEWYEFYVTNKDMLQILAFTLIIGVIILLGFCFLNSFYYN